MENRDSYSKNRIHFSYPNPPELLMELIKQGKLKIGFLTPYNYTSGGAVYIRRLVEALKKQGVKIIHQKYFVNKYGINIKSPKFSSPEIADCDLLHVSMNQAYLFKNLRGKKVTALYHFNFDKNYLKNMSFVQRFYHSLILKKQIKGSLNVVDCAVAISNYTKQSAIEIFGDYDIRIIYPGIDPKKFKPQKGKRGNNKIRLLFVGNLIKRKGADLLPKIMDKLEDRCVLYYTSGFRTKKTFNQKNMFPLGKLSEIDLIKEYNKCDILLFPSRLEGFGYAVAEAMSCEKPVVCTNCSSLPELLVDGKGGFLCEMDNIDDFVEKIKILSADKNLRERMGKFNRKRVLEKFTLHRMAKEYLEVYQELLKEKNI